MTITASMVKELREKTGAGMMDCKKALTENDGDFEKSVDWLREKGIAKAAKKQSRIAAEGLTKVVVEGNKAVIIEINSETDFVAKNEQFLELLDTVANALVNSDATSLEEANQVVVNGATIDEIITTATATIGEKISFRRFEIVSKNDSQVFGSYMHFGGKISVITVLDNGNDEIAKDMAMQIASMNPSYVSRSDVDASFIEHERSVQEGIAANDESLKSKPENVLKGIIEGRISKTLQEICLVDQIYFKDPSMKVSKYLADNKTNVLSFVRYAVGEGIEKREENFAEEVAAQLSK
ncbi:MAG: translation elongation factor Ts [Erysipelotrichaceae bacterium]